MAEQEQLCLWVRPEPFDVGIVPVPPSSKLVHHNLRKLFAYAKNKGKSGFPKISYTIWKHVACSKLQIPEEIAWQYFETCDSLLNLKPEFREAVAEFRAGCLHDNDIEIWKDKCSVDLLNFLLFLYIQHAHTTSLKGNMVSGEEWPSHPRSPRLEEKHTFECKCIDESAQLTFVQTNLNDLIDLMVDPDSYGTNADGDVMVSTLGVQALGSLLEGTTNGRTIVPLDILTKLPAEAPKSGYSRTARMYSLRKLRNWIKSHLGVNPFGLSTCLSLGQRLRGRAFSADEVLNTSLSASMADELPRQARTTVEWSELQSKLEDCDFGSMFRGPANIANRILSNCNFAPESNRLIVCNQVCRRTVARSGDPLSGATVKIRRCQHSYLYLLSSLRSVTIEKCHDSTIVLGAVATTVNLVACENIQLIAVTRKFIINSCRNCTFFVSSQCRPVLVGTNEENKYAPYYTFYPSLEADMYSVGISASLDLHERPITIDALDSPDPSALQDFSPDEFFRFSIPFSMEGTTKTCPFKLSPRYQEALQRRDKLLEEWHQKVREANLSRHQRQQLQMLVQSKFQEWLKETGNQQLLESLAPQTPIKK